MLNRRRTLLRCERENKNISDDKNTFYTVAVDVARYDVNTAVTVFKNTKKDTMYKKNLVYIEIIHGANFVTSQAPRIKELIELYQPREVIIDGNGLNLAHYYRNIISKILLIARNSFKDNSQRSK